MRRIRTFVLPFAFTAGFTAIKWLVPSLGIQLPFILYFGAVLLSVAAGGWVAGVLASVLCGVVANTLFLSPTATFSLSPAALLQTATFLLESLTTVALVDIVQKANARIDTVQRFTSGLSSAVRPEQVADLVVREGAAMLGAATGVLVRPRDATTLELVASHGVPESVTRAFAEFPVVDAVPSAVAFRTGQVEWIDSRVEFERRYPAFAKASLEGEVSSGAAALPLIARGRTIGAVAFRFSRSKPFGARARRLLGVLAEQAAQALDRAMLHASEVEKREGLEALTALAASLAATLDWDEVAQVIVERGRFAARADTCTFFEVQDEAGSLALRAERGCRPEVIEKIRWVPAGSPNPSQKAMRERASVWVESEREYEEQFPGLASLAIEGPRARAFWCVPLIADGRPLALLGMGYFEERRFSPETRAFIEAFCSQCAQALDRARRVEGERRARAAAEQARTSLATTLRSIGDAVIATDLEGRITTINPVACALTGWMEEEALGRSLTDVFRIVNEETRAPVENPVDKVLRERVVAALSNHSLLLGRHPGMETPIDDSGAPIRDGGGAVRGVVLVFRSSGEARRRALHREFLAAASAALASSLDYHRTLSRVAELAVPRLADWCSIVLVEDGALRQLAVAHFDPAKVVLARELGQRYPTDPNGPRGVPSVIRTGKSEFYPELSDELLERGAVDEEHLRIMRELRLHSGLVVPLTGSTGVLGAVTLVFAESERRYTVDDLAFAEDFGKRAAMAIENARLYAIAERERERADASNRAKDAFLATVSHELRTPLNAILGWSRILAGSPMPGPREVRALQVVERNAVAMAQLIEDLLDISRIISGQLRLDVQPIDVEAVIEASIDAVKLAAETKQIRIDRRFEPRGGAVLADAARIQQVVWNLLSNAVKFTPKGGAVQVILRSEDANVVLEVVDTGKGIDAAFLPYVFDPFRQADASFTRSHGGLGLGLAITRHIVEIHGGTIRAESEGPGRGARFSVRFPQATARVDAPPQAAVVTGPAQSAPCPSELRGLRVLVVDDEEDARQLVSVILENCGAIVSTASSVDEALLRFADPPDVLLSDIGMPGQDGFDLMRRVRALGEGRADIVPAAALTAYARAEDRRAVLEAGFLMHVPKPVEPAELLAVVASLARYGRHR